jgi:hypothetical protein
MLPMTAIFDTLFQGLRLAGQYWWIWLPVILGLIAYREWFEYQQAKFLTGLKWTVLEVIPPPDVPFSSPKAADNIFAGLHATYGGGTGWKGQFFQGRLPAWFSFEIVSNGGETHFYIRCTQDQRNLIEGLIFSQYPEAEIRIVPDYIDLLPAQLDLKEYDMSGADLEFTKAQPYPIKTYPEFEEAGGKDEYSRLDPIAPLVEIMSALVPGEHLWLQFNIRATGGDWVKEGQKVVDKLGGKPEKPAATPLLVHLLTLPFTLLEMLFIELGLSAAVEPKKEEKVEFNLSKLTPAQKNVLEAVEKKLAKLAFKTGIRLVYTAPKNVFNGSRIASVTGMFKQLYYNNLNSFKPNRFTGTRDKGVLGWIFPNDVGFFASERTAVKKKAMYEAYRTRTFAESLCILTTEELATLWHLPGINVKAPLLPRVQAKKGQPPAILPTR